QFGNSGDKDDSSHQASFALLPKCALRSRALSPEFGNRPRREAKIGKKMLWWTHSLWNSTYYVYCAQDRVDFTDQTILYVCAFSVFRLLLYGVSHAASTNWAAALETARKNNRQERA